MKEAPRGVVPGSTPFSTQAGTEGWSGLEEPNSSHDSHHFSQLSAKSLLPYLILLSLALMAFVMGPCPYPQPVSPFSLPPYSLLHMHSLSCPNSQFHLPPAVVLHPPPFSLCLCFCMFCLSLRAQEERWQVEQLSLGAVFHFISVH